MLGKVRRKQLSRLAEAGALSARSPSVLICPVCEREIPDAEKDAHHLVPKSKGGRATEYLHRICHRQIHALFTETELARELNTAEALRAHPLMQTFIDWVATKPPGFYQRVSKSDRVRRR